MSSEKSLDTADCVVFGVLTAVGYIVGIYFSFSRRRQKLASSDGDVPSADFEAFLGGQSLPSVALAVSVVASVANGMNVVGFVGHYYAYGFHALWILAGTAFATTFAVVVMIPLLYRLGVASIFQVIYDSGHVEPPLRSMSDLNVTEYMFRIAVVSSVFVVFFFFLVGVAGGTIIYWYRDCDPLLSGAIKSYDQVVPYYLKESLSEVTAMRGLFLAGLLGATTSTVSSVVNSHAATFYIDVIAPYYKLSEEKALIVMRLLAFASGAIMTLFAIAVPALGTATRLFLNFYASASGPFSALVILAVTSPWVNSKGAAWASLVVCAFQIWHAVGRSMSSVAKPPVFPGTLDRCPAPENITAEAARNLYNADGQSAYVFPLYRLSFFWSSFFGALMTITLAVVLSFATVSAPRTLNGVVVSKNRSDDDERTKLGTELTPVYKERTSSDRRHCKTPQSAQRNGRSS
ncbi:hypothetical protein HPB52_017850 [Rhipicephalus sanguineus]|uniref:Sodium-dependent multivitamin transporter n=1 Tax=Rhipicephalus sanguineus TaxID=34632 RepID=A0A9D4PLR1_RHISA|nr:hypothetical protein HPB52_017850 [Rhipicephalus sanguineus]